LTGRSLFSLSTKLLKNTTKRRTTLHGGMVPDLEHRAGALPSGPLHDAAEVARAGIPTVMMFVQSLHGISHNKIEDTKEEHLEMSVEALYRLAEKTAEWILTARR
jgi:acetylornithine deacetylase/succinyl-diaminopimelate desuccinylase-like protein